MIFLDTEDHWIIARDRQELVAALLAHLDPKEVDLPALASACLDCQPLDVVVLGD